VPNKATRELREFLQGVVQEAMRDPACRRRLVQQIKTLRIDVRLLRLVLVYGYGKEPLSVEITQGEPSLAQIIAGTVTDPAHQDYEDEPPALAQAAMKDDV
jgi:hypothetical protein